VKQSAGTVKWFNNQKGFGFIRDNDGEDLFVHYSDIRMEGRRELAEGQRVSYEVEKNSKGLKAINVVIEEAKVGGQVTGT